VRDSLSHIFGEAHADGESDKLITSVTKQAASQHREWSQPKAQDVPAADLCKMLSQHQGRNQASVMINGVEYVAKVHDVMYQVSNHKQTMLPLALIDCGANGGVAGSDTRLIDKSLRSDHIQGIEDHMIKDVPIGTFSTVVNTQRGEVIAIMHQYAYTGKGGTTGSQLALANGTVPTYKGYEALLKSAASTYDQAHAPAKCQLTRSAERTDIWEANITKSFHEAYEFGFDIDTPTDIVQAHMRDQLGVIPKETFG
jgi:hypothetical protein